MKRRILAWLLVAAPLLAGAPGSVLAACKLDLYASLPVEITDEGGVVMPVDVNGRAVFIYLHMSQGLPAIYPSGVEYLGLTALAQNDLEMTVRGIPIKEKVVVKSLRIGGANFTDWAMYVLPVPDDATSARQVHGLPVIGALTSAFMSQVDVELNLAQKRVNLFKQATCKMGAVYWGGEVTSVELDYDQTGLIVFPLEIEGKKVEASFNTAGSTSRISELVTSRFFGFNRDSPGVVKETLPEGIDIAHYRAMALTAKGLSMKNVRIRLENDMKSTCDPRRISSTRGIEFQSCISKAPMSIGTDLLRQLRIYIATKEGKIYFTRAPPAQEPPAAP